MRCTVAYPTKEALKDAVAKGEEIGVFKPGPFSGDEPINGETVVESHPNGHGWVARVHVHNGVIVKVV